MEEEITIVKAGMESLHQKPELPVDGLPQSVRTYIDAVCHTYHCPREFVTAAVLATASTAVGKKIRIDEGKYRNSLVLWFVLVARSGSNKSYPIKLVTGPLRNIDQELYDSYRKQLLQWKNVPEKDRDSDEPRCPAIVLDDCTDERRSEILFINGNEDTEAEGEPYRGCRGAIGIYPELKGMFDAKNQYQNSGTAAISKLLRLFDCEDIKVDRRNGFTMLVRNPFCNILGDLQTGMLRPAFGSELFMTNGLNQRFLFCIVEDIDYPARSHASLPPDVERQWDATVRMLYQGIYHDGLGGHHTLFRRADGTVSLSEDADRLYSDYYNSLQKKKELSDGDYEASVYSKLQIQVLRLAGIVHALEVAEQKGARSDYHILRPATMEYAIRCMDYFEKMALLVYRKISDIQSVKSPASMSNAEFIREFFRRYPNVSQSTYARLTNLSQPYISRVLNDDAKL